MNGTGSKSFWDIEKVDGSLSLSGLFLMFVGIIQGAEVSICRNRNGIGRERAGALAELLLCFAPDYSIEIFDHGFFLHADMYTHTCTRLPFRSVLLSNQPTCVPPYDPIPYNTIHIYLPTHLLYFFTIQSNLSIYCQD